MKVRQHAKRTVVIVLCIVFLLLVAAWIFIQCYFIKRETGMQLINSSKTTHDVSVVYINAGRADSILVQVDGQSYLIDTGLKSSVDEIEEVLNKYEVNDIAGIFLTHTHKDHVGGLKKIAKNHLIKHIYSAEISMDKKDGTNEIDYRAESFSIEQTKLSFGDKIEIASDVYFEVLGPITYNDVDDNDNSLVLRMYVNGKIFLFAGDMQFSEEQTLLDKKIDVSADIYKVGNHGNPDATSENFAEAVSPEVTIITTDTSVDEDSANARVIEAFKDSKVLVTEDFRLGILVKVHEDGEIQIEEA